MNPTMYPTRYDLRLPVPHAPWALLNRTYGASCGHTARIDEHGGVAVNLRLRRYAHLRRPARVRAGAPSWEASWWAPPATEASRPSQTRAASTAQSAVL